MDRFFDKLGDLVRSLMNDGRATRTPPPRQGQTQGSFDPDMQDAWEELDAYLGGQERPSAEPERPADPRIEALRQDYANLEVPLGAPFEQVKKSYRRLLASYHPDRNSDNPEKLRLATEITQKLNASYHRIEELEAGRSR